MEENEEEEINLQLDNHYRASSRGEELGGWRGDEEPRRDQPGKEKSCVGKRG